MQQWAAAQGESWLCNLRQETHSATIMSIMSQPGWRLGVHSTLFHSLGVKRNNNTKRKWLLSNTPPRSILVTLWNWFVIYTMRNKENDCPSSMRLRLLEKRTTTITTNTVVGKNKNNFLLLWWNEGANLHPTRPHLSLSLCCLSVCCCLSNNQSSSLSWMKSQPVIRVRSPLSFSTATYRECRSVYSKSITALQGNRFSVEIAYMIKCVASRHGNRQGQKKTNDNYRFHLL